jgi:uncharacterized membrane protein
LLRIYHIDHQSLWYDEALSLTLSQPPLGQITDKLVQDLHINTYPPLYFYTLYAWFKLFGFGVFQARLLSAVYGTLAIVMIYFLARYLFGHQVALFSALLLAVSQLGVMYSQEARPYAQLLFFFLCSTYTFIIALQKQHALLWWSFIFLATLMLYTHYYGVFIVGALLLYAILYRKHYTLPTSWWIGGMVLALVLLLPWLASGIIREALHNSKALSHEQPEWFAVHWSTFFRTINQFNNSKGLGLLNSSPLWMFLSGCLLFTVPAIHALKPLIRRAGSGIVKLIDQENLVFVGILWLIPMLLVIGLGALNIQYAVRYVAFCTAPYYILVALGITRLNSSILRQGLIVIILIYSLYALHANYFIPYKENYRDALADLADKYEQEDCCIFLPFKEVPPQWSIYHGSHPGLRVTSIDSIVSGRAKCERVWLITYRRISWAISQSEEGKRELATTHSKIAERQYFWVDLGLYMPQR